MRLTNLASILRDAGLRVVEESDWKKRGSDTFGPLRGFTIHETRGNINSTVEGEINVLINGRPGLSGPISQLFLSRIGVWYVIASGTCHHNKVGWAGPNIGLGNDNLLGIEAQHALNEQWTNVQYESYVAGTAALCEAYGISVNRIGGHKEHQPGDKTDPSFNMDTFRQRVAVAMREEDEDMPSVDEVWAKSFAEYTDENGNDVRDKRTVADILYATHRATLANSEAIKRIEDRLNAPTPPEEA